jgi:UDP-N-acetylglucosamine 4,6-dehydratase/5-epimerase
MTQSKRILVTGGTGSFGKNFIKLMLEKHPEVERLVVYSRDELKQSEMSERFPTSKYPQLRYFIGDVRDKSRLLRALEGIDTVIHAAALKQVPAAEYNPMECIKTNILGAENVIDASLDSGVKNVVALSTDKACSPINLYGATKLCSDKLFVAANNMKGNRDIKFSVVRYGNVLGSRGSVLPFFMKKKKEKILPVTDKEMTRFNITLEQAVDFVLLALERSYGGEIFVPKIPSFRILDMAEAICKESKIEIIGIRPGEKIHEEMISETDALNTLEFDKYFVIHPAAPDWSLDEMKAKFNGKPVERGFEYNSGTNHEWLTVPQLEDLIEIYGNFVI